MILALNCYISTTKGIDYQDKQTSNWIKKKLQLIRYVNYWDLLDCHQIII